MGLKPRNEQELRITDCHSHHSQDVPSAASASSETLSSQSLTLPLSCSTTSHTPKRTVSSGITLAPSSGLSHPASLGRGALELSQMSRNSRGHVRSVLGWFAWVASWVHGHVFLLASSRPEFGGFHVCGKGRGNKRAN